MTEARHFRTPDLVGQIFGKWQVLSFSGYSPTRDAQWLCRCNCGLEKPVKGQYLLAGQSKSCVDCAHQAYRKITNLQNEIPHFFWRLVLSNAKKRNIPVTVTKNEALEILLKQDYKCQLSGMTLTFAEYGADHNRGRTNASLDRIDRNYGYCVGNVQWLHKHVNRMKNVFTDKYFIDVCKQVTQRCDDLHLDTDASDSLPSSLPHK